MHTIKQALALTAAASLFALPAAAQERRPPKPNLAEMASAMEVSEEALVGCLPKRQSGERSRPPKPNSGELAACLKKAGFSVTEGKVSETLEAFRPQRHQRQ